MATRTGAKLALLACLAAATLACASAAGPAAHGRACGAAFSVLRRCAAATAAQDSVRERCCGLLTIFRRNGCLCPGCPPGTPPGATTPAGQMLAAQLEPLPALCDGEEGDDADERAAAQPAAQQAWQRGGWARPQQRAASEPWPVGGAAAARQERWAAAADGGADEDDLMADMAGRAAWAQDPRSRGAADGPARPQGALLDTPEDDFDNQLSDGDAAFMLVDPREAARHAARAAQWAAALAADARADAGTAARGAVEGAEGADEDAASAAAVSDDAGGAGGAARVRLAAAPDTPEQRRAAALAAAVEQQQLRNLARRAAAAARPVLLGGLPGAGAAQSDAAAAAKRLSVDITIDGDNPEAARRMVGSLAALLRSWQAASGSAASQAELAAALEGAAARLAAAAAGGAAPLGRAGLQPRQLELTQTEEAQARRTCACLSAEPDAAEGLAAGPRAALRRGYLAARLALCRFACSHERTLAAALVAELALCVAWLALWLLRYPGMRAPREAAGDEPAPCCGGGQFLIATAADPAWHVAPAGGGGALAAPLLCRSASASSISSC